MNNADFNYAYQYENWHSDNEESKRNDINASLQTFKQHNIFPKTKNSKVLEIGCGMGRTMLALKSSGYDNITGIDIDEAQIKVASKEGLDVLKSDASDYLKNTDEIYDVIYMFDVLEHIEKSKQLDLLKAIYNHLSQDGFLVIRVPNALSPIFAYYRYTDFTHHVSYTDTSLSFLAKNAGFSFIETRADNEEPYSVRKLKSLWYKLYLTAYNFEPILTENITSVIFKDKATYENYINTAPQIINDYNITAGDASRLQLPKWLVKLICCFIPGRKNRKNFREKHLNTIDRSR